MQLSWGKTTPSCEWGGWEKNTTDPLTNEDRGDWLVVVQWNSGTSLLLWLLVNRNWFKQIVFKVSKSAAHTLTHSVVFVILGIFYSGAVIRRDVPVCVVIIRQFLFRPLECHRKPGILLDNLDKENHSHSGHSVKLLFLFFFFFFFKSRWEKHNTQHTQIVVVFL